MRLRPLRLVFSVAVLFVFLLCLAGSPVLSTGESGPIARAASSAQGSWTVQSSGTRENLYSIAAPTHSSAWAVGSFGTIVHTSDGQ
jgi:hypothetical protein